MQDCVHTVTLPCVCLRTYILPLIKIFFRQILFNVVYKAFSRVQIEVDA